MEINTVFLIISSILFIISVVYIFILHKRSLRKDDKIEELNKELESLEKNTLEYVENNIEELKSKYENYISRLELSNNNYSIFFKYLKERIQTARIRMEEVDRKGSFKSDDEVGFIFNTLFEATVELSQFFDDVNVKEIDEDYLNQKLKE